MNAPATHKNVTALELVRALGGVQNAAKRGRTTREKILEKVFYGLGPKWRRNDFKH